MIKTPSYTCLKASDFDHIYEPAEDSFLLIDALEKDFDNIIALNPKLCCEIGSGSGVVIAALGSVLKSKAKYVSTDINPKACDATRRVCSENGIEICAYNCDLVEGLPDHTVGNIDILLFNPPYVPTDDSEVGRGDLEHTWAGGSKGRVVMDRLFPKVSSLLSNKGVFYLLLEKENEVEDVICVMQSFGFLGETLISRRAGRELLSVVKFCRKVNNS